MNIKHRIKARSELEQTFIEAIEVGAKIIFEKLNIQNVDIQCQRQTGWAGTQANHFGMFVYPEEKTNPMVKINFKNLSGFRLNEYIRTLAHEARHAYQYQNEWISSFDKTWNGEGLRKIVLEEGQHKDFKFDSYVNSKCEIDARNHENSYSTIILNHPDFKPFLKYVNETLGDKVIIKDYEKTYQLAEEILGTDSPIQLFTNSENNITYCVKLSDVSTRAKKWSKAQYSKVWSNSEELFKTPIKIQERELTTLDYV